MQYCSRPGCSVLVKRGTCPAHTRREIHGTRTWYYSARWSALRLLVCREQAYACASCGQVSARLDVDHIRPHYGNPVLFWDRTNLQALCSGCHAAKTRRGA